MGRGDRARVEERDVVGRGVVKAAEELGCIGNHDAAGGEAGAHVGVVEPARGSARVHFTGLAAAGTAVETGGMRVVAGASPVADKYGETRKVMRKTHPPEHALGDPAAVV